MEITIAFSCEESSMLITSKIEDEINYNSSLNVIVSIGPIPCFHFDNKMLNTRKVITAKTTMSDCGSSRNSIHK